MSTNHLHTRGDFRCSRCRDKNCFHCEHDTLYRDRYLGIYDEKTPRDYALNSQRSVSESRMYSKSTRNRPRQGYASTGGQKPRKQLNSTINPPATTQYGNSNTGVQNQHTNGSIKPTNSQQAAAKSKSCVIL